MSDRENVSSSVDVATAGQAAPARWMVIHQVYRNPSREFWTVRRKFETLRNSAGRTKRFRSADAAHAACVKANAADGVDTSRGGEQ